MVTTESNSHSNQFNQKVMNFPFHFYQLTIKIFIKKFVIFIHIEIFRFSNQFHRLWMQ